MGRKSFSLSSDFFPHPLGVTLSHQLAPVMVIWDEWLQWEQHGSFLRGLSRLWGDLGQVLVCLISPTGRFIPFLPASPGRPVGIGQGIL